MGAGAAALDAFKVPKVFPGTRRAALVSEWPATRGGVGSPPIQGIRAHTITDWLTYHAAVVEWKVWRQANLFHDASVPTFRALGPCLLPLCSWRAPVRAHLTLQPGRVWMRMGASECRFDLVREQGAVGNAMGRARPVCVFT